MNLAPHQSNWVSGHDGVPTFGISHSADPLSGDDMMNATNIETNTGNLKTAYTNASFKTELSAFIKVFNSNEGAGKKTTKDFIRTLRKEYGIKATVVE